MNITEGGQRQRRLDFKNAIGFDKHDKYPFFGFEVEGPYLFVTYFGEFFHLTPEFTGELPTEERDITQIPRIGRIEVGDRQASDFSEQEIQVLHQRIEEVIANSKTATASAKAKYQAEVDKRVGDAKINREARTCNLCEDINSSRSDFFAGNCRVFKCSCGIRYVYDRKLRWWERKTEAESEHEIRETLWVLRNGEPNYCG